MYKNNILKSKIKESVQSVAPITGIVMVLCFTIVPISTDIMLSFIIGTVLLILGLSLFSYGSEVSITHIGHLIGAKMTKTRNIFVVLIISFLLGAIVTVAEPDLQVLAVNVPHINTYALILAVSLGVALFLVISMVRILFRIPFRWILILFYGIVFALAYFADKNYLSVAFDSGGVTTGPMTAPFIIAFGVGVSAIRSDEKAEEDGFGLVAMASIGPILAVLLLGFFYRGGNEEIAAAAVNRYAETVELGLGYILSIPKFIEEVSMALSPITLFFIVFNLLSLRVSRHLFINIMVGLLFVYMGLILFLTGVNVGFSSLGIILGRELAAGNTRFLILPIVALMGWFVVQAEPAVQVLTEQVEEISAGAVSKKAMRYALSIAISLAMVFAAVRILLEIPILYFVVPGYMLALLLSFVVPQMFTAIAFDAGGVASGPMSATFMLPFYMGVCQAIGGNILTDAFGMVALVALMPPITIQIMGVITMLRTGKDEEERTVIAYDKEDIMELW